ncbi:helix-turn-helix transcriptional regulator [Rubellimicrobium mesophilum]|uniref:helix-turn-helix transcriptional regulator n=1 Tax=Rubellimicrobium mesophilum TaxID=1123067 RepID=UPI00055E2540|nr:helix-turn-helix transcriptional regulator [Rubellimicrobium mesophilum]
MTDAFAADFRGANFVMVGYDLSIRQSITDAFAGYSPECIESYGAHYAVTNPYHATWDALPAGRVVHSAELIPEEELLRTEYWNDWLRPQGDLRNAMGAVLARDPGRLFIFNTHIELRAASRISKRLMQTLRGAAPLLNRSLEINRMLLGLRLDSTLLRFGLEPEDAAILFLGAQGGILYANAQAERHLAEGTLLQYDARGRLTFANLQAAASLAAAIKGVARLSDLNFHLETKSGSMEVRMLPLTEGVLDQLRVPLLVRTPVPALLVVLRLSPGTTSADQVLQERLGLTAAEATVALALAEGATIAEIAEARGVSRFTVRDQVKRAMDKAGARRQADLVRRVIELRRTR